MAVRAGPAPVDIGSDAPIANNPAPPTLTSNDISLALPAGETAPSGVQESFTGVAISDPWAATQAGRVTATLTASAGALSLQNAAGSSLAGSGTGSLTFSDTLANINAELATLSYTSSGGARTWSRSRRRTRPAYRRRA